MNADRVPDEGNVFCVSLRIRWPKTVHDSLMWENLMHSTDGHCRNYYGIDTLQMTWHSHEVKILTERRVNTKIFLEPDKKGQLRYVSTWALAVGGSVKCWTFLEAQIRIYYFIIISCRFERSNNFLVGWLSQSFWCVDTQLNSAAVHSIILSARVYMTLFFFQVLQIVMLRWAVNRKFRRFGGSPHTAVWGA